MKLRSTRVCLVLASAALALAAGLVQFAEGRGSAVNENGRRAGFQFNVRKTTSGDTITRRGTAVFEIADRETIDGVRINMRELREIVVDGNVARFEGPGSIRFRTARGVVERRGQVNAFARDNRRPNGPVEPRDRIGVRFVAAEGGLTYSYEGNVREGDVAVGRRELN